MSFYITPGSRVYVAQGYFFDNLLLNQTGTVIAVKDGISGRVATVKFDESGLGVHDVDCCDLERSNVTKSIIPDPNTHTNSNVLRQTESICQSGLPGFVD